VPGPVDLATRLGFRAGCSMGLVEAGRLVRRSGGFSRLIAFERGYNGIQPMEDRNGSR
jgi:hypothetical protein